MQHTPTLPPLCCLPYATSQHASKCLEAEIAELERLMQPPQNDFTERP